MMELRDWQNINLKMLGGSVAGSPGFFRPSAPPLSLSQGKSEFKCYKPSGKSMSGQPSAFCAPQNMDMGTAAGALKEAGDEDLISF